MAPRGQFASVTATPAEVAADLPGDDLLPHPDVVMDRAFTLPAPPAEVWPWIEQLGKKRAGWYLTRRVERFVPRSRRAARTVDPRWQGIDVGTVIPDYGGKHETFTVARIERPRLLVYTSRRGGTDVTWAIVLTSYDGDATRVQLRLRLHPIKRVRLAESLGDLFDAVTIAGMAAGLRERLLERSGR